MANGLASRTIVCELSTIQSSSVGRSGGARSGTALSQILFQETKGVFQAEAAQIYESPVTCLHRVGRNRLGYTGR